MLRGQLSTDQKCRSVAVFGPYGGERSGAVSVRRVGSSPGVGPRTDSSTPRTCSSGHIETVDAIPADLGMSEGVLAAEEDALRPSAADAK
jgi:hypothetical protein